jgi:hypothetical protein
MTRARRHVSAAGLLVAASAFPLAVAFAQIGELPAALPLPAEAAKPAQNGTAAPATPPVRVIPLTRAAPAANAAAKPNATPPAAAANPVSSAAAAAAPPALPPAAPALPSVPAAQGSADGNVGAAMPAERRASRNQAAVAALPDGLEPEDDRRRQWRAARDWERRMGPFALVPLCEPDFWRWIASYLQTAERAVAPTAQQKSQFDELVHAAVKAKDEVQATCGSTVVATPAGRLAAVEARLASIMRAVQTVRPALDAFYASLNDEQKARLSALDGEPDRRGRQRHRHRWSRR